MGTPALFWTLTLASYMSAPLGHLPSVPLVHLVLE